MKNYIIGILSILLTASVIWLAVEIRQPTYTTETSVDSTTTVKRDTIPPPDTVRVVDVRVEEPDSIIPDTVIKTETDTFRSQPDNKYSQFRRYNTTVTDSLLTGTIKTTVQGFLVTQNFSYSPQYPLQINVNTETRVTERVVRTVQPKAYPSIGVSTATDFKTLNGFEITGSWTTQKGNRFTYGYNPVFKQHSIGFSYNLRNLFK